MSNNELEKKDKELVVECHHCDEENIIKLSNVISCKNCKKPISGHTVKYKSNGTVIIGSLLAGVAVGAALEDKELVSSEVLYISGTAVSTYAFVARAKLETEYKMMKKCINKFGATDKVRNNCFCVVKKLSSFMTSTSVKDKDWVEEELEKKYEKCSSDKD